MKRRRRKSSQRPAREDLPKPAVRRRRPERPAPILTLEAGGDVETEETRRRHSMATKSIMLTAPAAF